MKKLKIYAVFTKVVVAASSKKDAVIEARKLISERVGTWAVAAANTEAEIEGPYKIIKA